MTPLPPYFAALGIVVAEPGRDARPPLLRLPPADIVIGRPGFLHGGAIAGLLECAGILAARHAVGNDAVTIRPIGMTVDYLRGGVLRDSFARGRIVRNGARITAVEIHGWQDDADRPIAVARMNLSLMRG